MAILSPELLFNAASVGIAVASVLLSQHRSNERARVERAVAATHVAEVLQKQELLMDQRMTRMEATMPLITELAVVKGNQNVVREINGTYVRTVIMDAQIARIEQAIKALSDEARHTS